VRRDFVLPATESRRCRYVDIIREEQAENDQDSDVVGEASSFVSHAWAAPFGDLVTALCDGNADPNRRVWLDFLAVTQWPGNAPELAFESIIRQCQSFVIVITTNPGYIGLGNADNNYTRNISNLSHSSRSQIALFRIWCLAEIHAAVIHNRVIVMKCGECKFSKLHLESTPSHHWFHSDVKMLIALYFHVDVSHAEATVAADRERIMNYVESAGGGVDAVNRAVRGAITGAQFATDVPKIQNIACGDDLEIVDTDNPVKVLLAAASNGLTSILQQQLTRGVDIESHDFLYGMTALMCAASSGRLETMNWLLQQGCDVNRKNRRFFHDDNTQDDYTALMLAASGGHTSCVQALLECGCEAFQVTKQNESALHLAARYGHVDCVSVLLSCPGITAEMTNDAVRISAVYGQSKCFAALSTHGVDVTSVVDGEGASPILLAAKHGHKECFDCLLEMGCSMEVPGSWVRLKYVERLFLFACREGQVGLLEASILSLQRNGVAARRITSMRQYITEAAKHHSYNLRACLHQMMTREGLDVNRRAEIDSLNLLILSSDALLALLLEYDEKVVDQYMKMVDDCKHHQHVNQETIKSMEDACSFLQLVQYCLHGVDVEALLRVNRSDRRVPFLDLFWWGLDIDIAAAKKHIHFIVDNIEYISVSIRSDSEERKNVSPAILSLMKLTDCPEFEFVSCEQAQLKCGQLVETFRETRDVCLLRLLRLYMLNRDFDVELYPGRHFSTEGILDEMYNVDPNYPRFWFFKLLYMKEAHYPRFWFLKLFCMKEGKITLPSGEEKSERGAFEIFKRLSAR
jgi:hypothetical protein